MIWWIVQYLVIYSILIYTKLFGRINLSIQIAVGGTMRQRIVFKDSQKIFEHYIQKGVFSLNENADDSVYKFNYMGTARTEGQDFGVDMFKHLETRQYTKLFEDFDSIHIPCDEVHNVN